MQTTPPALEGSTAARPGDDEAAYRADRDIGSGSVRRPSSTKIIYTSPQIAEALALTEHASKSRVTVLITGETGTGKELFAREIHAQGSKRKAPFIAVNCAAFPESLLESELFGHKRGAFTGADRDKSGPVRSGRWRNLFLDEIGETARPFQAKTAARVTREGGAPD